MTSIGGPKGPSGLPPPAAPMKKSATATATTATTTKKVTEQLPLAPLVKDGKRQTALTQPDAPAQAKIDAGLHYGKLAAEALSKLERAAVSGEPADIASARSEWFSLRDAAPEVLSAFDAQAFVLLDKAALAELPEATATWRSIEAGLRGDKTAAGSSEVAFLGARGLKHFHVSEADIRAFALGDNPPSVVKVMRSAERGGWLAVNAMRSLGRMRLAVLQAKDSKLSQLAPNDPQRASLHSEMKRINHAMAGAVRNAQERTLKTQAERVRAGGPDLQKDMAALETTLRAEERRGNVRPTDMGQGYATLAEAKLTDTGLLGETDEVNGKLTVQGAIKSAVRHDPTLQPGLWRIDARRFEIVKTLAPEGSKQRHRAEAQLTTVNEAREQHLAALSTPGIEDVLELQDVRFALADAGVARAQLAADAQAAEQQVSADKDELASLLATKTALTEGPVQTLKADFQVGLKERALSKIDDALGSDFVTDDGHRAIAFKQTQEALVGIRNDDAAALAAQVEQIEQRIGDLTTQLETDDKAARAARSQVDTARAQAADVALTTPNVPAAAGAWASQAFVAHAELARADTKMAGVRAAQLALDPWQKSPGVWSAIVTHEQRAAIAQDTLGLWENPAPAEASAEHDPSGNIFLQPLVALATKLSPATPEPPPLGAKDLGLPTRAERSARAMEALDYERDCNSAADKKRLAQDLQNVAHTFAWELAMDGHPTGKAGPVELLQQATAIADTLTPAAGGAIRASVSDSAARLSQRLEQRPPEFWVSGADADRAWQLAKDTAKEIGDGERMAQYAAADESRLAQIDALHEASTAAINARWQTFGLEMNALDFQQTETIRGSKGMVLGVTTSMGSVTYKAGKFIPQLTLEGYGWLAGKAGIIDETTSLTSWIPDSLDPWEIAEESAADSVSAAREHAQLGTARVLAAENAAYEGMRTAAVDGHYCEYTRRLRIAQSGLATPGGGAWEQFRRDNAVALAGFHKTTVPSAGDLADASGWDPVDVLSDYHMAGPGIARWLARPGAALPSASDMDARILEGTPGADELREQTADFVERSEYTKWVRRGTTVVDVAVAVLAPATLARGGVAAAAPTVARGVAAKFARGALESVVTNVATDWTIKYVGRPLYGDASSELRALEGLADIADVSWAKGVGHVGKAAMGIAQGQALTASFIPEWVEQFTGHADPELAQYVNYAFGALVAGSMHAAATPRDQIAEVMTAIGVERSASERIADASVNDPRIAVNAQRLYALSPEAFVAFEKKYGAEAYRMLATDFSNARWRALELVPLPEQRMSLSDLDALARTDEPGVYRDSEGALIRATVEFPPPPSDWKPVFASHNADVYRLPDGQLVVRYKQPGLEGQFSVPQIQGKLAESGSRGEGDGGYVEITLPNGKKAVSMQPIDARDAIDALAIVRAVERHTNITMPEVLGVQMVDGQPRLVMANAGPSYLKQGIREVPGSFATLFSPEVYALMQTHGLNLERSLEADYMFGTPPDMVLGVPVRVGALAEALRNGTFAKKVELTDAMLQTMSVDAYRRHKGLSPIASAPEPMRRALNEDTKSQMYKERIQIALDQHGVFTHFLTKGGLVPILESNTLQEGEGQQGWGHGVGVRAMLGPNSAATPGSPTIDFRVASDIQGHVADFHFMGTGVMWNGDVPLQIERITFPDGAVATPEAGLFRIGDELLTPAELGARYPAFA